MKRNDPSTANTVTDILAAMVRVLSGHPTVATPGDLTITAVVAEAQVKRHLLTHKHTALKELFYQLRDTCSNPLIVRAEKTNGEYTELTKKLAEARNESRDWKATAQTFARAIHVLTIENAELKKSARRHRCDPFDSHTGGQAHSRGETHAAPARVPIMAHRKGLPDVQARFAGPADLSPHPRVDRGAPEHRGSSDGRQPQD